MLILGIGGLLGDAAAAILKDGELVAAVEESKLVRRRRPWGDRAEMPERAIATCLDLAHAKPEQVDAVAVVRPLPGADFHLQLRARFPDSRLLVVDHHLAHAASAYYLSPFDEATVLTLDRGGDFRSGARWLARGTQTDPRPRALRSDSIGDLYGRVTELLGFESREEEHKVQWLSVGGDDRYTDLFLDILRITDRGPRIDGSYFSTERLRHGGFSARFYERLGLRDGEAIPEPLRAHVAAGMQRAVETAAIQMAGSGRISAWPAAWASTRCWFRRSKPARHSRTCSCSRCRATPAPPSARCSTPGTALSARPAASPCPRSVSARNTPPPKPSRWSRIASCASNTC